jgi:hypothetical protein
MSYSFANRADRHNPGGERDAAGRLEPDRSRSCVVRIRKALLGDLGFHSPRDPSRAHGISRQVSFEISSRLRMTS